MNYQESLEKLEKEKKKLEEEGRTTLGGQEFWKSEASEKKWRLIEKLIKSYSKSRAQEVSDDKVEEVFSKVHGFDKQKQEIKSIILTQKYLKAKGIKTPEKGKVFCFVGSPGVGKTYFANKFAEALGRGFFRINLGGASSAVIITGGKGIWSGSEPGGIINAILETESCDPIILLDEIEKTGEDKHYGTIKDALLHVLDPEQRQDFTDQFLNVGIDISRITFIATANEIEKIPEPLKNRLEIIKVKDYDESQKISIGKILIDKIFRDDYENNNKDLFEMSDGVLAHLIKKIKEGGARQLESKIKFIINWCFTQWAQKLEKGEEEKKIVIDENKINELISEDTEKKEEDSEEEELRKKVAELEQENKKLSEKKLLTLSLTKYLEISPEREFCSKHKKNTLHTSDKICVLCELDQFTQQQESIIGKENLAVWEKFWSEKKAELLEKAQQLVGSEQEKDLAQAIRNSVKKINKKKAEVKKSKPTAAEIKNNKNELNLFLKISIGVVAVLIGIFYGWLLVKIAKKKRTGSAKKLKLKRNQPYQFLKNK
ncbi:MAG: AAA family ATPase [Candidatus Moeniiplasma glomeromycotorum]|nr:AAA family ATPase [Candidatus Moeniiplasma glomeromycotorum]MCE8168385.1 AAA family ATPase [Candidatus Moeniiplasma glomeromycotorum]MCE8169861.1 AAA family ATPase [Candidatus Moeniiplasma glomeromycotorum]